MKDSRQRSAAPVRPAIFTAAFVAKQSPECLAGLLNCCFYDLVDAERTRSREIQAELLRSIAMILSRYRGHKRYQPKRICRCGQRKYRTSTRCSTCYGATRSKVISFTKRRA